MYGRRWRSERCQGRVAGEQLRSPVIARTASIVRVPLVADAPEDARRAGPCRARAPRSARRCPCRSWPGPSPGCRSASGRRARSCASGVRLAIASRAVGRFVAGAPSTAEPKPYHPGRSTRLCAQLKTHGMARRSSMRARRLARRRAAADVELRDLGQRRRRAEVVDEARRLVDEAPGRPRTRGARAVHRAARGTPWRRSRARCRANVASSVAATMVSRLRRPTSRSEYLLRDRPRPAR